MQGRIWWVGAVESASQRVLWAHGLAERVKRVDGKNSDAQDFSLADVRVAHLSVWSLLITMRKAGQVVV